MAKWVGKVISRRGSKNYSIMLEKDAKKAVMLYLYRRMKEEGALSCNTSDIISAIPAANASQIRRIVETLRKSGYLNGFFTSDGNGYITELFSTGIEYVEDNYLSELPGHSSLASGPVTVTTQPTVRYIRGYRPQAVSSVIKDMQNTPCFDVDSLAGCYANLIKDVSSSNNDNVAMLGIFAPWGRGKSYFFSRVKQQLPKERFDVVEFNAWKYQETPALWAYLFESFLLRRRRWFRFRFFISWRLAQLALGCILYTLPILAMYLLKESIGIKWVVAGGSLLAFILKIIAEHGHFALDLIKKQWKGISFAPELGVQAEVEKELEHLLGFWIRERKVGKKTVVLYVDDLDRCEYKRMVAIIDSLRTVLENEEIRKRLLVVCSVDSKKLLRAIRLQYAELMSEEDEKQQIWNAQDQLDKLFLCSLSLPKLEISDELEFLEKLSGEHISTAAQSDEVMPAATGEELLSAISEEDSPELSHAELVTWIADNIEKTNLALSPRAISHIYYRCLLAMNILHAIQADMTVEIVEQIIQQSYGYEMEVKSNNSYNYGFVVDMVVPYEYPREKVIKGKEIAK